MKKCTRCGKEKPATREYFSWHKARPKNYVKEGYRSDCKECQNELHRMHREARALAWEQEFEGTRFESCEICNFNIFEALCFHHDEPLKKGPWDRSSIEKLGTKLRSVWPNTPQGDEVMKAIEECTRLCQNCHALVHANKIVLPKRGK